MLIWYYLVFSAFWICGLLYFINFRKVLSIVSSDTISVCLFLLLPGIPSTYILDYMILSHSTCMLFCSFHSFFLYMFEQFYWFLFTDSFYGCFEFTDKIIEGFHVNNCVFIYSISIWFCLIVSTSLLKLPISCVLLSTFPSGLSTIVIIWIPYIVVPTSASSLSWVLLTALSLKIGFSVFFFFAPFYVSWLKSGHIL